MPRRRQPMESAPNARNPAPSALNCRRPTMQRRSSDSIGALAVPLAKAQSEIARPEKSLTATIISAVPPEGTRSVRYAPLAARLDLIRKCLGRHEIATLQTTPIDQQSGLICLTPMLVHASGEWVSSVWPVCSSSEITAPHRLGAALTYARRYALFTLVGIAGEDDLDAPNLATSPDLATQSVAPTSRKHSPILPSGGQTGSGLSRALRGVEKPPAKPNLSAMASKDLQRQLILELNGLTDLDALAGWAHRVLPLKGQLSTADAKNLEAAFAEALVKLGDIDSILPGHDARDTVGQLASTDGDVGAIVAIPKPIRERDRHHLKFVAAQPCLVCGRTPTDAH